MSNLPKLVDKIDKAEQKAETPAIVSAIKLATYPLAALTAYLVGKTEVRKAIYKNFAAAGAVKDIQPAHRAELVDILNNPAKTLGQGPALTEACNHTYRLSIKERFEKAGFHGVVDYWKGLHPNQKANALIFAAGGAGVAITTLLAFVNNKTILEKLTAMDKEQATLKEHTLA